MTGRAELFRYYGRSMWPFFQEGDLLEVAPLDIITVRRGDCVAFRSSSGQTVAHRVVHTRGSVVTRGDSLPTADNETLDPASLIGKVVCIHRMGRKVRVRGGHFGRLDGFVYRHAGRVDPQRTSRGGILARRIRSFATRYLLTGKIKGKTKAFKRNGHADMIIWEVGNIAIGRMRPTTREWSVSWPWSIVFQQPD